MDNVPVNVNGPASAGRSTSHATTGAPKHAKKGSNKLKHIIIGSLLAVVLAIVVIGGLGLYRSSVAAHIDGSKYQAVFFTNGQVYFGKLERLSGGYFKLSNIFYLQAQNTAADSKNPQQTTAEQAKDVQLIKLGSEVHGPDDEMIISKDQVLFFENLKKDGKVTDSIVKYQAQKK